MSRTKLETINDIRAQKRAIINRLDPTVNPEVVVNLGRDLERLDIAEKMLSSCRSWDDFKEVQMKLEDVDPGNVQLPDNVNWDMVKGELLQYEGEYVIWTQNYIVAYIDYESCDRWIVYEREPSDYSDRLYKFG